ncbi:MAG: outer membrane beta-barrel protein [Thermodesulfobacteriota bacterium]
MKRLTILFLVLTLISPLVSVSSHAQSRDQEIQELKRMIEQNRQQNEALMNKIEQMESEKAVNQLKVEEFMVKQEEKDQKIDGFLSFFDTIDLGFYVDTTYQYVFDRGATSDLQLRSLYPDNQQFAINAFTISVSKTPTLEGGIMDLLGFRADILFGEQAPRLSSNGLESDVVDPYQAYLQFLAPVGTGLNVYAGRFVTLAGYEVIEARSNPNITRSILFGFAIPFTHTGIRTDYTAGPLTLTAGLNNGWDQVKDANGNVTMESQIAFSHSGGVISDAWFGLTGYFGREPGDIGFAETNGWRELITAVGTVTFNDWITFIVDADFGWQQDIIFNELGSEEGVSWWGIAGYVVLDVHPAINLALRGEYFDDEDGFRTGTAQKLFELTPTISVKPFKGLIAGNRFVDNFEARAEFRWDHSDERYFEKEDGGFEKDQYGIMAQLLYWIEL